MTKRELIHEVAYETGIQISDSKEIVDAVFKVLSDTLIRGEDIRIAGFASFKILDRPARNMINNATGEKMRTKAGKRGRLYPLYLAPIRNTWHECLADIEPLLEKSLPLPYSFSPCYYIFDRKNESMENA